MDNKYFRITRLFQAYSIYNIYIQNTFRDNDLQFFIESHIRYTKENIEFELLKMVVDYMGDNESLFITLHYDYTQKPFIQISCDTYNIMKYESLLIQFIKTEILPECTRKFNLKTMIRKKFQDDLYKTKAFVSWYKNNPDEDTSNFDIMYQRIMSR